MSGLLLALSPDLAAADTAQDEPVPTSRDERVPIEEFDLQGLLNAPVVTASGGQVQQRALAPANVFAIGREEIARRGWRTLADVLASVPGIYVIDDLVLPSVGVRGVNGGVRGGTRIVKLMINGVPVSYRPERTAFLGPEYIPIEAVERVEVVQGPLSALYGANAFLATVNVITRAVVDAPSGELAMRGFLVRGHGGFGLSLLLSAGDAEAGILAAVSADHIDRSGLRIEETFAAQDPQLDRYRDFFDRVSEGDIAQPASAFLQLYRDTPQLGRFTLQGGLQRSDAMGEFQVNSALTHRTRYAVSNLWSNLRYERDLGPALSAEVNLGYARGAPTRDERLYLSGSNNAFWTRNSAYHAVEGGATVDWQPLGERLALQFGIEAEYDRERVRYYTQTFLVPLGEREAGAELDLLPEGARRFETLTDVGLKLQVASTPWPESLPGLHLTGNLRIDRLDYGARAFPAEISARAAVIYDWREELSAKLVAGRAFQAPSGELMFGHTGYGNANNLLGNVHANALGVVSSQLRPQTVTSVEGMVSAGLLDLATVEASLYYQNLQDAIQFNQVATDFVAENGAAVASVGGTAVVRVRAGLAAAYATASLQRRIEDGALVAQPPPLYPVASGVLGCDLDLRRIRLLVNGNLRWASARGASQSNTLLNNGVPYSLPAYAELDLTLSTVDLPLLGAGGTRLLASVRNLLNQRHSEPGFAGYDLPNLGRLMWLEIRHVH
jgi:iron complex outermembrane receptor protein